MRFASSAATRHGRMERLRRDRASAQVVRAAFPTVQYLRIKLEFKEPYSNAPTPQSHILYPPAPAFFEYACPSWECDGQFDLSGAVKAAVVGVTHRVEGVLECGGSRGGDHTPARPCLLQLAYEVSATLQQRS
jgi:hypothetical protein